MPEFTPEVRARMEHTAGVDTAFGANDLRLALHHIDALEARVAVLAAECRAWRVAYDNNDCDGESGHCRYEGAPYAVVAATDAAGALEGGRS